MRNKMLAILAILGLVVVFNPALAAKPDKTGGDPQNPHYAPSSEEANSDGTYDVPGHPELKVKVHVYKQDARGSQSQKSGRGRGLQLICNLPDPESTSVVPAAGWHLATSAPIAYRLNVSSAPSNVGSGNLPAIAVNAFDKWSGAVVGAVTFTRGSNTSVNRAAYDGQNVIAWGRTSAGALAVTYIWYYPSTGLVAQTDTIFNVSYPWAWSNPALWSTSTGTTCAYKNVYDAQDILTHETGHWMGLDDTYASTYTDNTMFGYGSTRETKKDTLTAGDKQAVDAIY